MYANVLKADYYPKQNPLNQRLYSNCFQYINRKRSTDEKHGNRQSFTGNTVNSRSQLWYSIQQISVYYQCQHEEEDKPWNTYLLSFALENKGSSKSHRDNPKRTGQFNSGCHFQCFFAISSSLHLLQNWYHEWQWYRPCSELLLIHI